MIAIIALIILVVILAVIVHIFRKHKMNSVRQAEIRRNSSLKKQGSSGLTDEKMEGKKEGEVDIFQASDKKGLIPSILPQDKNDLASLEDGQKNLIGAPTLTNKQIAELMKGKSGDEKREFL